MVFVLSKPVKYAKNRQVIWQLTTRTSREKKGKFIYMYIALATFISKCLSVKEMFFLELKTVLLVFNYY